MSQTARSGSRTGAPRPLPQPRGTRHAASGEGPPLRRSWPESDALRSISFLNGVTGLERKDASEQGRPCRVRRGPGRTALRGKREGRPAARRPQTSRRNLLTENQLACLVPKALLQFQLGRCLGDESCPQRPKPGAGGRPVTSVPRPGPVDGFHGAMSKHRLHLAHLHIHSLQL